MQKPLLSIGIIFKNEIRCLERCMKSLEPLRRAIPCELVMADTGSDDGSREIAENYADILIDFPWIDDFAAARNAVLDHSSGKWFMTLDADEWLDPNIKEMVEFLQLEQVEQNFAGFTIRNYKSFDFAQYDDYKDFYAMRIMRNGVGVRYEGRIHEHWKYPESMTDHAVVRLDALVYHDGYAFANRADMQAKRDRNMRLLKKKLEENPDDLQTLAECVDTTKTTDDESAYYARRALEVLHRDWEKWREYGARIYRDAVSVAQLRKLPELLEWAEKAVELYPDSIYTQVDVAYCGYARCWDNKNIAGAIRWGEMYRNGVANYNAGNFNRSELFRGILDFCAPYWERRLLIMQTEGYLELGNYEEAVAAFGCIQGDELDEGQQVEACVNMLLRLHRESVLDTSTLVTRFWREINHPSPNAKLADKRRVSFINTAASSLTPRYRSDEASRDSFMRHGYEALIPLDGECILGTGAAILNMSDAKKIEEKLSPYIIEDLPISALVHALKCGIEFPLSSKPVCIETMRTLAQRLIPFEVLPELAISSVTVDKNMQSLSWKRELLLALISSYKWDSIKQGWAIVRTYVETERLFLPTVYTSSMLTESGALLLPPFHRFGWYCARAFDALGNGDTAGYVHLLREGLALCEGMKDMVGFLVEHTEEVRSAMAPPPELQALAGQVRAIMARYDPNDPAVAALKQSEAYQKVAYLLERQ